MDADAETVSQEFAFRVGWNFRLSLSIGKRRPIRIKTGGWMFVRTARLARYVEAFSPLRNTRRHDRRSIRRDSSRRVGRHTVNQDTSSHSCRRAPSRPSRQWRGRRSYDGVAFHGKAQSARAWFGRSALIEGERTARRHRIAYGTRCDRDRHRDVARLLRAALIARRGVAAVGCRPTTGRRATAEEELDPPADSEPCPADVLLDFLPPLPSDFFSLNPFSSPCPKTRNRPWSRISGRILGPGASHHPKILSH